MSLKTSMRLKQRRKAGDPWVSTNRVLNGLGKKPGNIGRNPNFDTDETKLLIQLWGDPKVQRALITTHKKHTVISQLALKMQDYGYFRSAEEITTRIKNLKCFYNRIKKDIETGQELSSKPSWKHFTEMDAIMTRPIFSVRPDEVPAPSLKYRLEQAREERAERRKQIHSEGLLGSDPITEESDEYLDDDSLEMEEQDLMLDDGIIPDVEVDIDINDETFAVMTNSQTVMDAHKKIKKRKINEDNKEDCAEISMEVNTELLKDEENTRSSSGKGITELLLQQDCDFVAVGGINDANNRYSDITVSSTESVLMEPKQEPIDVDAEDDVRENVTTNTKENNKTDENNTSANVQQLMPTLADILQLSKDNNVTNATSSGQVLIPISNITTMTSNTSVASSSVSATSTVTTAATAATTTTTAAAAVATTATSNMPGMISLVPTNFLMQPNKHITARMVGVSSSSGSTISQGQQIHLLQSTPQLQPRLLFSGAAAGQVGGASTSAGIMTTGPGGMKVLLLSAEQAAAAAAANPALAAGGNFAKTLGTFMPLNATNMLLQPHVQQMQQQKLVPLQQKQQQQQQQQHQSTKSSTSSTIAATAATSSSPISSTNAQQLIEEKLQQSTTRTSARKKQQQHHQHHHHHHHQKQQQQRKYDYEEKQSKFSEQTQQEQPLTKKDATNLRILLRQLLNVQFESNTINSRRWKLERERLEFEKSVAERFFTTLPNLFDNLKDFFKQTQQQQQQQKTTQQKQQTTSQQQQAHQQPAQLFQAANFMTVSSAGSSSVPQLRLQPPKLLFTAVRHPTLLNAQNNISLTSPTVNPLLPKASVAPTVVLTTTPATTTTSVSENPLLTPKLEPQDN